MNRRPPVLAGADSVAVAAVALGGAAGAGARYGVGEAFALAGPRAAPLGILTVNVVGCALMGVLVAVAIDRWPDHRVLRPALGTGVLGGFTTFSSYAVGVLDLARDGRAAAALAYLVATPVLALLAVWGGTVLARRMLTRRVGAGRDGAIGDAVDGGDLDDGNDG